MKYIAPLIVVTDLERSKAFYKKHLGLEVEVDFGANVTLTGGIALQTKESWSRFIGDYEIKFRGNDAELYFESIDFDSFIRNMEELELVHPPYEHEWGQRTVRFYDPDGHIIEVSETMEEVVQRFSSQGMKVPEIAAHMDVDEKYVQEWMQRNTHEKNTE